MLFRSLLSWRHWLDYLNLWILLIPGLAVATPVLLSLKNKMRAMASFFGLTIGVAALTVFLLDPKLSMPRDWDLFSFAAVPAVIGVLFYLLHESNFSRKTACTAVLFCTLGLIVLLPRVAAQSNAGIILEHVRLYRHLDPDRCQNMEIGRAHV